MSGSLFGAAGQAFSGSPGAAVESLLGVGSLTLGGMSFQDWALPERVTHGGQQQLTVHKLPGGARVIDDMGDDPAQICWSGLWFGIGAASQRAQLEAIRTAGDPVDLTWSDQSLTVLLADCQYDEEHDNRRIRYRVTCTILPDAEDDEDQGDDGEDTGPGETPETPAKAADTGKRQVSRARTSASAMPVPPVPPANPPLPAGSNSGAAFAL